MVYKVKMQAYNDVGSSDFSAVQSERTRDAGMILLIWGIYMYYHLLVVAVYKSDFD